MNLQDKLLSYIATMKSDFPAALAMTAEDIVWINHLPAHIPFGGEYHGHDGLIQYFQELSTSFEIGDYMHEEFEFFESDDALVMVGYEKDGKALPTGKVFDLSFVWVVKFNDEGKICYVREHNDTAAIGDAFKV